MGSDISKMLLNSDQELRLSPEGLGTSKSHAHSLQCETEGRAVDLS